MLSAEPWFLRISKLKVDRSRGDLAPHKPLLLLVLLEMAEQGALPGDTIALTPELSFRFLTYWSVVAHRRSQPPNIRLPFHHLQSDGFWTALGEDRRRSPSRDLTRHAQLAPGLQAFLGEPANREKARRILIAKYFLPHERIALYTLCGSPVPPEDEIERDADYQPAEAAVQQGREIRFRLNVVAAYNYTCALTGYRLTTVSGASIVDAAHIHQFSDSRNNDPRNGLALCKNAHWLFDQGLWTLSDDLRVMVATSAFTERSPDSKPIASYDGQQLRMPGDKKLWPSPVHLAWHRKHKFQRCA